MIPPITPDDLEEHVLRARVYPNLDVTHHWTDRWEPSFYADLARAGFISIAIRHPEYGDLLLPEIQSAYAVLDWAALRAPGHVRRLLGSGRIEAEGIELRVSRDCRAVVERIERQHAPDCWLIEPYVALVHALAEAGPASGLEMHAVELWSSSAGELVAGELGYTIGRVYTSLSGFCSPDLGRWNHFGSLQLYLLAERLRDADYAFWNLGHPHMDYKRALGAAVLGRGAFLKRWFEHREESLVRSVGLT